MKIKTPQDLANIEKIEDFQKFASISIRDIVDLLNGKLDLIENLDTSVVTVVFTASATNVSLVHTLDRVPMGYIVVGRSAGITVYDGTTANTDKLIYVRASGAGTVKILVF